jgi:L-ribulose-5-phosphate 3-epimerase UlaE
MHVKDEIKGEKEQYESTILGTGIVGVADVLKLAAKHGGTTEYIIEQESYQGKLPIDSVKADLAWIKAAKF